MNETALSLTSKDRPAPSIVGYVEAVTDTAALGWTWRPGTDAKLAVELRLNGQIVAKSVANGLREDLARSGIGDGHHAFTLPIPEAVRPRSSELSVFAIGDDGVAVALNTPPGQDVSADGLGSLQRGVDMLIGSQRLMHRNLQVALQQQPSVVNALGDIAAAQTNLRENIATFELFAIRLEQALAAREAPGSSAPARRSLAVVTAIASVALLSSCWALWRTVVG